MSQYDDLTQLYGEDGDDAGGQNPGLTKEVKGKEVFGRPRPVDTRLFSHDVIEARASKPVRWHVSKDDRMPAVEAGRTLKKIQLMFGLGHMSAVDEQAFIDGLLFCHTINSGSTLQPGRAVISLHESKFEFKEVVELLGLDVRRFFRTYADEVRRVNKFIISERYRSEDPEAQERFEWLKQVAEERGMGRYPDLAHDSADACSRLTPDQRNAVMLSKQGIFANSTNTADTAFKSNRGRVVRNETGNPVETGHQF